MLMSGLRLSRRRRVTLSFSIAILVTLCVSLATSFQGWLASSLAVCFGCFGAWIIADRMQVAIFSFRPHRIGELWQTQARFLSVVREGVFAVDRDSEIIFANPTAVRIFHHAGLHGDPVGQSAADFLPMRSIQQVVETSIASHQLEMSVRGLHYVVNCMPIIIEGKPAGAMVTVRDQTELKTMTDQLTSIKQYADALRVQTHEFVNKMHVILGMVHIGEFEKLAEYIRHITSRYQFEVGTVSRLVQDPVLAGFVLSRLSYAREHDVVLNIHGQTVIPPSDDPRIVDDIITILGNLVENSIEAVESREVKRIDLSFGYSDGTLTLTVRDTGGGVNPLIELSMFLKGFSTKGQNRGFGLPLVWNTLERRNGHVHYHNTAVGMEFTVTLPYILKKESST